MNDKANLLILIAAGGFVFLISLIPGSGFQLEIGASDNVGGLFLPFLFALIPVAATTTLIVKLSGGDLDDNNLWTKVLVRILVCILFGLILTTYI